MQSGAVGFGVDRSLPVGMSARDRCVRRVIQEHAALLDVKERGPVCGDETLLGERFLRCARSHHSPGEEQHEIG